MNFKENCMSYWLPKLIEIGVPTPKTIIIDMNKVDDKFVKAINKIFWMKDPTKEETEALIKFKQILEEMGHRIEYPLFLRSGHSSHKHNWKETCYVEQQAQLISHAQAIAEYNIMANHSSGLPINVWAVRKIIETAPAFKAFNEMPITKEIRYFFKDHKLVCKHPYWPEHALEGNVINDKNWKLKLSAMNSLSEEDDEILKKLTKKVALRFDGYWSIDWLKGKDGNWYAIDMATGEDSYHCPECEKGKSMGKGKGDKPKKEKKKPKKKGKK